MTDNIVELGRHDPTVDSVIERLDRNRNKIKHITAVIEWENGDSDICHDTVKVKSLAYDAVLLDKYVKDLIREFSGE